jgi:hypothetical protein
VPVSILSAFPGGTYGFIRALCARDRAKEYAIDLRTPLFQKSWNRVANVRDAHRRVASILGEPFRSAGLQRALVVQDFPEAVRQQCVKRCIEYQLEFRFYEEAERKLRKYQQLLGLDDESMIPLKKPQHLIPPYFQFESIEDDWFDVTVRCVHDSMAHRQGVPVRPVLHFDAWDSLGQFGGVAARLPDGIESVWLYPNNFREHDASLESLQAMRGVIEDAAAHQVRPYTLHGGYLSVLMGEFGLAGFGNGVGYGEWRDSGYHRGGQAGIRVYALRLHRFLPPEQADSLLDLAPEYFGDDDLLFAKCLAEGRSLLDVSLEEALDHFMRCRQRELETVGVSGITAAVEELRATVEVLEAIGELERREYGDSLQRWIDVVSR